jgi:hypothetical protein
MDVRVGMIKPFVDKVYGDDNYIIEYNTEAEGAKSGILYIKPKRYLRYKGVEVSQKTIYDDPNPPPTISVDFKYNKAHDKLTPLSEYQNHVSGTILK